MLVIGKVAIVDTFGVDRELVSKRRRVLEEGGQHNALGNVGPVCRPWDACRQSRPANQEIGVPESS